MTGTLSSSGRTLVLSGNLLRRLSTAGLFLPLAVVVFAAVITLLNLRQPGRVPGDAAAAEQCRAAYRSARTAADSASVDMRRPVVSRGHATVALSCGVMRVAGQLR
jgi:hypothetical protein